MEDTEKTRALKKVYAEMILNTAKEAAARVMASERKVHQLEYDIKSTKDEAIRLLLRFKQTMDVKINEAEMKSLDQQRRIEELEAQLQEAEDIVSNLRAELDEAHMKLEEMEQVNNASKISEDARAEITKPSENKLPEAVLTTQTNSSILTNGNYFANNSVEEFGFSGDLVVPSIIRSKKPELYRNGCTQRIRAYEGNLLNGHFSLSGEFYDLKREKCIREGKEGEGTYVIKEVEDVNNTSNGLQTLKSFRRKRRRASRNRRSNASIHKEVFPSLAKQAHSNLSNTQTVLLDSQDIPENGEIKVSPSNLTEIGDNAEALLVGTNVNTEVASSLVMIRNQNVSSGQLDVPSSKENIETNSSLVNPDSKLQEAGDGLYSPPPKDRVLKYTFQRKRKRESLVVDNGSLNEENPMKKKMVNKENGDLDLPNSSSVAESARDSRRMAQVARQLLTLSDKKWWK